MPDLNLLWAVLVALAGYLVFVKLRLRRPKEVRCLGCKIAMEHDADIRREILQRDSALSPFMRPGQPQAAFYHYPQCGRRTRVNF
jgi:hypothetical protein